MDWPSDFPNKHDIQDEWVVDKNINKEESKSIALDDLEKVS